MLPGLPDGKLSGEFYLKGDYSDYTSPEPSFIFMSNNKVTIRELAVTYEGTYKVEGSTVTISYVLFGTNMVDIFTINSSYDTLTGNGNTYVKKRGSGHIDTTDKKRITEPKNLQPVSQQEVESALRFYDSVTIISRDTDSMIESVTYKAIKNYKYMDMETIGIVAFEFDLDMNEWMRYEAGDKTLSQEENWEKLSGQYEYIDSYEGGWGTNSSEVHFELTIKSFDGEFVEGSYSYYTRVSNREYTDSEDEIFSVVSEPPIAGYKSYRYFVRLDDCDGRQPRFTIDRDEGIHIVPSLKSYPVTKIS